MKFPPRGRLDFLERTRLILAVEQEEKQATYRAIMEKIGCSKIVDFGQNDLKEGFEAKRVEDAIKVVLNLPVYDHPELLKT